ncbi:MAG: alpha-glucan family phosphorylase [Acidobacteriota bacterium]
MNHQVIAYFSMEIGINAEIPTYSGGLGVLAGDTIRAAADLKVPLVAVTLLHRKGYFHQRITPDGWQTEEPAHWAVDDFLEKLPVEVCVSIESRTVRLGCWRYEVTGISGFKIPVYFLDTDLPQNSDWDRELTHYLYGGDRRYRLCQEVILGIGGIRLLRALGHQNIERFHLNEGHSSLLTLELLDEQRQQAQHETFLSQDIEAVRDKCIFTTHTPVPAGHDQFPLELAEQVLGRRDIFAMKEVFCCEGRLNLTYLALNLSRHINGVAKKHMEVSRSLFAHYEIDAITNGVHAATWTAQPFQTLFDRYIPGWRQDNFSLRSALRIAKEEIWAAHQEAKKALFHYANHLTNAGLDMDVFTLGFARRATEYKRWELLFADVEQLKAIATQFGGLQIIFSGKAHPQDQAGKRAIKRILELKETLRKEMTIVFLENYDMEVAKFLVAGADVWLNTPLPPFEASGTSGMKAALNGVPSLSVLDGWWLEGHIEGVTGWAIGEKILSGKTAQDSSNDARSLYDKLAGVVLPLFYQDRRRFLDIMAHAIALNGSFFNAHRMIEQYVLNAYFR